MFFNSNYFNTIFTGNAFMDVLFQTKYLRYEILVAVGVLFLLYLINSVIQARRIKLPPGPTGLPLVGYLPFLTENIHLEFTELGKKYGDIFSVRLGTELVVVLNGTDAIREALGKNEFLGRPPQGTLRVLLGKSTFFVGDVHTWKEQRRFVVQSMKDHGLGKTKIETDIQDEINHFLEVLRKHEGKPMDLKKPLSPSMSNNITALVFGKRMEYDHPERKQLDESLDAAVESAKQGGALNFYPVICKTPFLYRFFKKQGRAGTDMIKKFCMREISKHKETFDPRNIRDFIDSYIVEMKNRQDKDPNTTFRDETLVANVFDLYAAGSETVRTTILWCIYIMAAYPEVQKKVQREILDIIGPDRNPEFQDQKAMPYTHAVILEIMRWKTIVAVNVFRYTVADTTVGGYDVPKDSIVIANWWMVHHDPRLWIDPDSFNPDRFLSSDKSSVVKPNYFMPFSIGKRACPGEIMANMEVFMYFTSILQKFDVLFPEGVKATFSSKFSGVLRLDPYKVRFIPKDSV